MKTVSIVFWVLLVLSFAEMSFYVGEDLPVRTLEGHKDAVRLVTFLPGQIILCERH